MKKRSQLNRWLVGVTGGWCLVGGVPGALAEGELDLGADTVRVRVGGDDGSYYILYREGLDGDGGREGIDVTPGWGGAQMLEDPSGRGRSGFYRVETVPVDEAGDLDGDGIDDVYELRDSALDPLRSIDASGLRLLDGESVTALEYYLNDDSLTNISRYNYEVGCGIWDVTGVAADGGMMGYAKGEQVSAGIRDRQWARAFIFKDRRAPFKSVVYVVVDNGQLFHSVTQGVLEKIENDGLLAPHYGVDNVVMSATHTHGAAGGHSHHLLFNISIGGYSWQTYDALVSGIYRAIRMAHANLRPGRVLMADSELDDANENRALEAFRENPEYWNAALGNPFGSRNRDTEMRLLRIEQKAGAEVGMLNWFPVHGVSYANSNRLLTGDNKGYAAFQFERGMGTVHVPAHGSDRQSGWRPGFVGAFANSNPGDLTANRWETEGFGPDGVDDPSQWYEPGVTRWPGNGVDDDWRIERIGGRQLEEATSLYSGAATKVWGGIDHRLVYVDFGAIEVDPNALYPYDQPGVAALAKPRRNTCPSALGLEFTLGARDGLGLDGDIVAALKLRPDSPALDPSPQMVACHEPKDIILVTSENALLEGRPWTPQVLPVSILKVGRLAVLGVPAEFTSTAAHRLKQTVKAVLGEDMKVVLSGLSNSYAGYVTTYEEYHYREIRGPAQYQTYEAASTHFGPMTLVGYQTVFKAMAESMVAGTAMPVGEDFGGFTVAAAPQTEPSDLITAGDPFFELFDDPKHPTRAPRSLGQGLLGGCADGQFSDSGECWSCDEANGYVRPLSVYPITHAKACVKPAQTLFRSASQHNRPQGCPAGQYFDPLTFACWTCPTGYNVSASPIWQNPDGSPAGAACHQPASSEFRSYGEKVAATATFIGVYPIGYYHYSCPGGGALQGTSCYKCPSGYNPVALLSWEDGSKCEKVTPESWSAGIKHPGVCPNGQFFDLATWYCWSCSEADGYFRYATTEAVTGSKACEKRIPEAYQYAVNHGEEKVACADRADGAFWDLITDECWTCDGWDGNALLPTRDLLSGVPNRSYCFDGGVDIGDVTAEPLASYRRGETVEVRFWAAHPKRVFGQSDDRIGARRRLETFMRVERHKGGATGYDSNWETVATDADWGTQFEWRAFNLAAGKPAGLFNGAGEAVETWPNQPASNINDGTPETYSHPLASSTQNFYFEVDLLGMVEIGAVELTGRTGDGCCPERLDDARVRIYDESGNWIDGRRLGGQTTSTRVINYGPNFPRGRYVRVYNVGTNAYSPQIGELVVRPPHADGPEVVLRWAVADGDGEAPAGSYRIRHYGRYLEGDAIKEYEGKTRIFQVEETAAGM